MYTEILRRLVLKTPWNPTEEAFRDQALVFLDDEDAKAGDSEAATAAAAPASGAQGEPATAPDQAHESEPATAATEA